jgi:putative FmdB family regulatory protein
MYSYKCPNCGHRQEVTKPMSESDLQEICGSCDMTFMDRDFAADLFSTPKDTYSKPIVSNSMAVAVDQIAEHKALYPNIRMTNEGQPIFEKFSDHEKYLKDTGFVKNPGKIRKRVKKITTV